MPEIKEKTRFCAQVDFPVPANSDETHRGKERKKTQHSGIRIIFLLSVTPSYLLAFPALSEASSISIPPSSHTPFSVSSSGFYLPLFSPVSVGGN